jgi:hypothetical protein
MVRRRSSPMHIPSSPTYKHRETRATNTGKHVQRQGTTHHVTDTHILGASHVQRQGTTHQANIQRQSRAKLSQSHRANFLECRSPSLIPRGLNPKGFPDSPGSLARPLTHTRRLTQSRAPAPAQTSPLTHLSPPTLTHLSPPAHTP